MKRMSSSSGRMVPSQRPHPKQHSASKICRAEALFFIVLSFLCILRPLTVVSRLNSLVFSSMDSSRQTLEDVSGSTNQISDVSPQEGTTISVPPRAIRGDDDRTMFDNFSAPRKERAIFIICMGETATSSHMVERFVWSARHIGQFDGWIVLLTDASDSRYESVLNWTDHFVILHPEKEHYIQNYTARAMRFKQFKTYPLEYISKDDRLNDVEVVYYIDVDTVFGNSVWPMFQDLESRYRIGPYSQPAKMWMFEGNNDYKLQSGVMIFHRDTSQPCLERFRSLMDPVASRKDQIHLTQMWEEQNMVQTQNQTLTCEIVMMPQEQQYIMFPTTSHIKTIAGMIRNGTIIPNGTFAVLNHFKNTGNTVKSINSVDWRTYVRHLFRFGENQSDELCITSKMFLHKSEDEGDNCSKNKSNVTFTANSWIEESDGIERALFVISMGKKAAKSKIVERFVWSARNVGMYPGWIVVLTDAEKGRYNGIFDWTDNVIIMEPDSKDIKTHYSTTNMIYKRFKTLVLDYVDKDSRLDNVELVYYLDVDIVFGNSVWPLFKGLETTYGIGPPNINVLNSDHIINAKSKMWMFRGNSDKWPIQGGQIILDRKYSRGCQDKWRSLFDWENSTNLEKDQWLLADIYQEEQNARERNDFSNLQCEIGRMEQKGYIDFPKFTEVRRKNNQIRVGKKKTITFAPLVHLRNDGGARRLSSEAMFHFMKVLLKFKEGQEDEIGVLEKAVMVTTNRASEQRQPKK